MGFGKVGLPFVCLGFRDVILINARDPLYLLGYGSPYTFVNMILFLPGP